MFQDAEMRLITNLVRTKYILWIPHSTGQRGCLGNLILHFFEEQVYTIFSAPHTLLVSIQMS